VIKSTGFMKGLYGENEMKSDNVKDKDSKIDFLQKAIDVVMMVSGEPLAAKPARIVAGHEPEKTNEFLQALAKCCTNKALSSDDAVKRVLAGDKVDIKTKAGTSRSQDKENREGRERHPDREARVLFREENDHRAQREPRAEGPDQPKEQERRRDGDKEQHRDRERSDKHQRTEQDQHARVSEEPQQKPVPEPSKAAKPVPRPAEAGENQSGSPVRIPRPSSAKGQRRRPKIGGQDGEALLVQRTAPLENGDTTVPSDMASRLSSAKPSAPGSAQELDGEDKHGGLVKKILETKKDYEVSPSSPKAKEQNVVSEAARKKERDIVSREIERLRTSIQTVCRSTLPLGKIMDYIQEDMDAMQAELHTWRRENKEHAQALLQEQRATDRAVEPLKSELVELDQLIREQQDKICAVRSNILKNEDKIQKMVTGINFSSRA
ncbi:hypothetical protein KUCAC02_010020, partial [Chaenocephalus aceratus]